MLYFISPWLVLWLEVSTFGPPSPFLPLPTTFPHFWQLFLCSPYLWAWFSFLLLLFCLFIYPMLGLCCSPWDLWSSLGHVGSLVAILGIFFFLQLHLWDLVLWPRIKPGLHAVGLWSVNHSTTRKSLLAHIVEEELSEFNRHQVSHTWLWKLRSESLSATWTFSSCRIKKKICQKNKPKWNQNQKKHQIFKNHKTLQRELIL